MLNRRTNAIRSLAAALGLALSVVGGAWVAAARAQGPAAPHPIWGVDSLSGGRGAEVGWDARGMIPWQEFAQGEWVGHARTAQVPEYRLREGDQIAVYYRRTRDELSRPYELQVGDRILVESLTAGGGPVANQENGGAVPKSDIGISRELVIQPDGTISVPLVGQVRATRRTVQSLRDELEEAYKKFYRVPSITVTPIHVDTRLEDLLNTVDSRAGLRGGLQLLALVTPAGKIQLPAVDSVFVQGLTPAEAKQEIDARYAAKIPGVEVTIDLAQRAPRFIYVVGEVTNPGRFELVGHGRSPDTPVALIRWGTTAAQEVAVSTLGDVVTHARAARVAPPMLAIIGEVVRLRERLAWFEARAHNLDALMAEAL